MKIRNMRWGYDGGGMACGPVDGSTLVEICVTDSDGHNFFIIDSRMDVYERIGVSPLPLFDVLMYMTYSDVQFEDEFAKYGANVIEDYEYEIGDEPDEMLESKFAKVIHLARLAMKTYYGNDDETTAFQTALEFLEPYADKDIETIELPELSYDEEEWDEDEE